MLPHATACVLCPTACRRNAPPLPYRATRGSSSILHGCHRPPHVSANGRDPGGNTAPCAGLTRRAAVQVLGGGRLRMPGAHPARCEKGRRLPAVLKLFQGTLNDDARSLSAPCRTFPAGLSAARVRVQSTMRCCARVGGPCLLFIAPAVGGAERALALSGAASATQMRTERRTSVGVVNAVSARTPARAADSAGDVVSAWYPV
eukprot:364111-Chlamydomonas_euryale.AAC.18